MREILFRGKRIDNLDNGEWVEGNLFIPDEGHDAPTEICMGTDIVWITYAIDPDTISEFTGLYDANGKRIFEGDVVLAVYRNGRGKKANKYIGVIAYGEILEGDSRHTGFHITFKCHVRKSILWWCETKNTYLKVIGNKWDNPELLDER